MEFADQYLKLFKNGDYDNYNKFNVHENLQSIDNTTLWLMFQGFAKAMDIADEDD